MKFVLSEEETKVEIEKIWPKELDDRPSPNQRFTIELQLQTECQEWMTEAEVKIWMEEILMGVDVGNVTVALVAEHPQTLSPSFIEDILGAKR